MFTKIEKNLFDRTLILKMKEIEEQIISHLFFLSKQLYPMEMIKKGNANQTHRRCSCHFPEVALYQLTLGIPFYLPYFILARWQLLTHVLLKHLLRHQTVGAARLGEHHHFLATDLCLDSCLYVTHGCNSVFYNMFFWFKITLVLFLLPFVVF